MIVVVKVTPTKLILETDESAADLAIVVVDDIRMDHVIDVERRRAGVPNVRGSGGYDVRQ